MPPSHGANAVRLDKDQELQLENNAYQLKSTNYGVARLLIELLHSLLNQDHCVRICSDLLSMAKTINALIRHRRQIITGAAQEGVDRIIVHLHLNQRRKFGPDGKEVQEKRLGDATPEIIKSDPDWGAQLRSLFQLTDRAAFQMRKLSSWPPRVLNPQIERLTKLNAALLRQDRHLQEVRAQSVKIELKIHREPIADEPPDDELAGDLV